MTKGNTFENDLALLFFNAVPITGLADVGVADPLTVLYVSLHTGTLDDSGNQSTNEAAYGGYTRMGIARTSSGWSVANGVAENVADLVFPASLTNGIPIVYVAIGTQETGAGKILHYGPLFEPLNIIIGTEPKFTVGKLRAGEE